MNPYEYRFKEAITRIAWTDPPRFRLILEAWFAYTLAEIQALPEHDPQAKR